MTTNQTSKRTCKVITLQKKLAILKKLEAGYSRRDVELMFKCSQSTISRVLAGKEGIMQEAKGNVPSRRDSLISYKELDKALSRWAWEMKKSDDMITASLVKQKAEELSLAMGYELKPSTAWVYKWKERKNIKFAKRYKDPEEILKEFLDKKEKSEQMQALNVESTKKLMQDNEENKVNSPIVKEQVKENTQSESVSGNTGDSNKPRIKRDYIKRLPIIDASGMICRSRKEKTFLTLLQKLEILQRLKNGERRQELIVEYKLSQSAMSQIVTDEEKILKLAAGGQNLHMKRIRGGIFKGGEAELNAWVQQKIDNGESLTRTHIKSRAKEIANRLNINFKASTGWLEKWKARMNLDFNENQILQRKLPKYIPTDEEFESSHAQFEQSDSLYDQHDGQILQSEIKTEQMENNYCDMETNDEFSYTDIDATDVKPEMITPQQFYLQTIRPDSQASEICNDPHTEQRQELALEPEERDIKPFVGTPPYIPSSKEPSKQVQTLHEQILSWLNRYNIAPGAASELLNILQPHICTEIYTCSNPVQQTR